MSALIALLHQLQGESGFAALVLLDVPICPPRNTPEDNMGIGYTLKSATHWENERASARSNSLVWRILVNPSDVRACSRVSNRA